MIKIKNTMLLFLPFLIVNCANKPEGIFPAIEISNLGQIQSIVKQYPEVINLQYDQDDQFEYDLPLYKAIEVKEPNPQIVDFLLKESLKQDLKTVVYISFRDTLLNKNFAICDVFMNNGYDLNSDVKLEGGIYPAMFWEIPKMYKNIEGIKYLVEKGIDFNRPLKTGEYPLHNACEYGNYDVVKLMVENGANVNARDNAGITALFAAVDDNKIKMIELLLKMGADPNITTYKNNSSVNNRIHSKEALKLLLDYGLNINLRTDNNDGIIFCILSDSFNIDNRNGLTDSKIELLEYAIEHGAELNHKYKGVQSPLKYAYDYNIDQRIIDVLLKHGAIQ